MSFRPFVRPLEAPKPMPWVLLLPLLLFASCKTTEPQSFSDDGRVLVDPERSPDDATFLLDEISIGDSERPGSIALLGRNLHFQGQDTVALDVCLDNRSDQTLFADVVVWLSQFRPRDVTPVNADLIPPAGDPSVPSDPIWGFDYSQLLGDDAQLSPGELSEAKTWIFHTPNLAPFSFAANLETGSEPPRATITGTIFRDENRNGLRDADEPAFARGFVQAHGPEAFHERVPVGPHGQFGFRVESPGLYTLHYTLGFDPPILIDVTTPNPLQVLVPPNANGDPTSFDSADFGVAGVPGDPSIILTDQLPSDIRQDHYLLEAWELDGHVVRMKVGYSGCSPEHPLQLFMSGEFEESFPVGARLVLMHDDLGELCDAAFLVDRSWNLAPLIRKYRQEYGAGPAVVNLRLVIPDGSSHSLLFEF